MYIGLYLTVFRITCSKYYVINKEKCSFIVFYRCRENTSKKNGDINTRIIFIRTKNIIQIKL